MQTTFRVHTTVLPGHRLEVTAPELPDGAKVEVIVLIPAQLTRPTIDDDREKARTTALEQFLTLARLSSFRSMGAYPTRDDLYDRP
jgi:hypothetical protein